MADEMLYQLTGVHFTYPDGHVGLDGIDLDIRQGERVALAGANASGKSTLLRLLDGLYFAASGTVRAWGTVLTENSLGGGDFTREFRRRVGFMFQNPDSQLFCTTVEEEIAFGPLQLGLSDDEVLERIDSTLAFCGLTGHRTRSPHSLSLGEKKRVALASMLACEPSVLLLDEPTAGLDPRSQSWLIDVLRELASDGKTLVVATHDLHTIQHLADRVIVMNERHGISAIGSPETILSDRDLLVSVNLVHAHEHAHGSVVHVHEHFHWEEHEHSHSGDSTDSMHCHSERSEGSPR